MVWYPADLILERGPKTLNTIIRCLLEIILSFVEVVPTHAKTLLERDSWKLTLAELSIPSAQYLE